MLNYISFYKDAQSLIAGIACDIDHHAARGLREQIDKKILEMRPKILVLDFEGVSFMDSSGIGLIMGRHRMMCACGGTLRVENAPPRVQQMMELAGLNRLPIWNERKDVCETHQ